MFIRWNHAINGARRMVVTAAQMCIGGNTCEDRPYQRRTRSAAFGLPRGHYCPSDVDREIRRMVPRPTIGAMVLDVSRS
jgi:hypothetical protein